jgi:hypothetical protein
LNQRGAEDAETNVSTKVNPVTRRDLAALAIVLAIAAFVRLSDIGVTSFQYDEAILSERAMDMVQYRTIPTLGIPSSVGIPNPPTSVYVLAIPFALSDSPLFAAAFIAALNVAGVGLLWLLAHRYFNRTGAFIAGTAYALNPWAILYSRKIWAQDYHTPLVLLAVLLGLYGFVEGGGRRWRKVAQVACLPVLLFGLQIHFAAWALLPLYFWIVWLGRKRISRRAMVASLALGILTLLPFFIGLTQMLQVNPQLIGLPPSSPGGGLTLSSRAATYTAQLMTGLGVEATFGLSNAVLGQVAPPRTLWLVIGAMTLFGTAGLTAHSYRPIVVLGLLWAGLPLVVFTPTWTIVYPHYFIGSLPAFGLLAGIGIDRLIAWLPKRALLRTAVLGSFSVLLLTWGVWWRSLLEIVDTTPAVRGSDVSLHFLMDVRDELAWHQQVIVVTDDYWTEYNKESAVWEVLLRNSAECVRSIGGDSFAVFPKDPFAVLISPRAPENPVNNLYQTDAPKDFPLRPGEGQYTVYTWEHAPRWTGAPLIDIAPATFDNGIQLTGYHLDPDRIVLNWAVTRSRGVDYQYFAHFLDADGKRIGQRDATFLPGHSWCAGDDIITWTDIQLPQAVQTLRVGMYILGQGSDTGKFFSANVVDDAGNAVSQWVDIPLNGNSAH